tara:strand:+ start:120 stop:410 length:291 start_codon:yes stop_codon:yes gene_type:complete
MNNNQHQQDYDYINLIINNIFDNIINDLTNYKHNMLNNIYKFIYINNNNNINNTNILEKQEINKDIYYIDKKNKIIYNKKANIVGEIKNNNFELYI